MDEAVVDVQSLYEKQTKIHAREVKGLFNKLRDASTGVLLGVYYLLPWLRWDERQAVLFDLPARKFYIFGLTFWPQDFLFLSWLLIIAALLLFFVTALAGRVWCGYACPQTIWTKVFVWMERLAEGRFARRIKLDRGPWTAEKILRKTTKQLLWIGFALWTGFTFVGYFNPIQELTVSFARLELGGWQWFWIGFYSLATYGNAGYLREQVCKYMCPYARFQSAMFDADTLIVSYDVKRGEPRGRRQRGRDPVKLGLGDCVDCNICVQVCPTGIDIREGLQYECITCASCIDACDEVMDKMNYPRGLISYTTENALEEKPSRIARPRTLVYATLLVALCIGFFVTLANRPMLHVDVIRDRNALYRELVDGQIENVYTLKILNKYDLAYPLTISAEGVDGLQVDTGDREIQIDAGAVLNVVARVRAQRDTLGPGSQQIRFRVETADRDKVAMRDTRFFAPIERVQDDG
jgi:cytochrome c oxidase accessory protein FixG